MSSLHALIANGGRVLVVGGQWNKGWDSFKSHPQLLFWTGVRKEIQEAIRNRQGDLLPDNTRGVVLSRFISHSESDQIIREARRKQVLVIPMKNDGEITRVLEEITDKTNGNGAKAAPAAPAPASKPTVTRRWARGEQGHFVAKYHQPDLPSIKEAQRLMVLVKQAGVQSTLASMYQAVAKYRRSLGLAVGSRAKANLARRTKVAAPAPAPVVAPAAKAAPPVPAPPKVEPKATTTPAEEREGAVKALLAMVDDSISGMQLIREEVLKLHRQNVEAMSLRDRLAELLK